MVKKIFQCENFGYEFIQQAGIRVHDGNDTKSKRNAALPIANLDEREREREREKEREIER